MSNYKIAGLAIGAFALLALPALVLASHTCCPVGAVFNNHPSDFATVRVANFTQSGNNLNAWTTSLSGVRPGDVVAVAIYYHNNGDTTAFDTRIFLNNPGTGPASSYSFSGGVFASNASAATGQATIHLSSAQTLEFQPQHSNTPSAVEWYPNQSQGNPTPVPFGQSGHEIFTSSGLAIGDIAPSWSSQGSVVAHFKVAEAQELPPTVDLTANPTSVPFGGSSTLSWTSSNATSCFASGAWSGQKALSGSETQTNLTSTRTYTLTCSNNVSSVSDSVTVTVFQQQPTVDLTANPTSVPFGGSTVLSWTSSNATNCFASNAWSGQKALSGSETQSNLSSTRTYTLTCSNNAGSASDSVTVFVSPQQLPPTVDLNASPTFVQSGGSTVLSWTSSNATNCFASGAWSGNKALSGQETQFNLTSTRTYTLTCSNNVSSVSDSVTVTVGQVGGAVTPFVSLVASPNPVAFGGNVTLAWSSTNATSCFATGAWSGSKPLFGNETQFNITSTRTYIITCTNAFGSASDSETVTVITPAPPAPPPAPAVARHEVTKSVINLTHSNSATPVQAETGDRLQYIITVSNTGERTLTGLVVRDNLPGSVRFESASEGGSYNQNQHSVSWSVSRLVVGESKTLTIDVIVLDRIANRARSESDQTNLKVSGDAVVMIVDEVKITQVAGPPVEPEAPAPEAVPEEEEEAAALGLAFLPDSALGWLLLIILIIILVILLRRAFAREE